MSRRRITSIGKTFYEAWIGDNWNEVHKIVFYSLSHTIFGRNNNGIPDSDSDIEIPCLALRVCYELDKLTSLVYVYFIQMIQNHGFSYTQIIRKFKDEKFEVNAEDIEPSCAKYKDWKPISFLKDLGIFEENGRELYLPKNILESYGTLIQNLPIYNVDKYANVVPEYMNNTLASVVASKYRPYITAIKSKPFLLLAGISGTGKSRIVRELARACWEVGTSDYKEHKPKNYEMVQVKPNWHDSSELIGYVSRLGEEPAFIAGDFLKFIVKAWENPHVPYFLCLDEMNLAPVEQYFAEYLSVVESRKKDEETGDVVTDPILKPEYEAELDEKTNERVPKAWYKNLINELLVECPDEKQFGLYRQFIEKGISIPQNLIVVGTVNMDETTFSFSRKVLDRAMTIEMNEVNLAGGLTQKHETIGKLNYDDLVGTNVEGVDVYADYQAVCDKAIEYLKSINDVLEGTPFKVAYRTRNEFLLYVVNNLPYHKDEAGNELSEEDVVARALDEITSMKVLSRIEGDDQKVSQELLDGLKQVVSDMLPNDAMREASVSLAKLREMNKRREAGFTSFWS
ncbi:McrB family protein [Segatella copri]|uniref:McrB family protein n=1 Tax=Segatella copri TaxID=165179 RepID=UPI0018849DD4|nr:restriction endonuclease [Segatella copri]